MGRTTTRGMLPWLLASACAGCLMGDPGLDFEDVDASHGRVIASLSLARQGLVLEGVTPGTLVVVDDARSIYDGRALVAPSGFNVLTQVNSNDPVTYTLRFPGPVRAVRFTRPALMAGPTGIVFPAWEAEALDASGRTLRRVSEGLQGYYANTPARTFSLEAPGIRALRVRSVNFHFAAFSAAVIDDLAWTPEAAP